MPKSGEVGPGDKLSQLRENKKLSLRQAARLSEGGVSHAYISDLEKGIAPWSKASLTTIRGLARAYDLSVPALLEYINGTEAVEQDPFEGDFVIFDIRNEVIRSRRTVPSYHLTVSGDRGEIVPSDVKIYVDEDWRGDYDAYILESDSNYRTTIIARRQNFAQKGDEVVCEVSGRGVLIAKIVAIVGDTYFLKGNFEPFDADVLTILGVVVRKQEDRLS